MTDEPQDERIRVQLTLRSDSPAYALLKACKTPTECRKTAISLMETAAAAITAGFGTPHAEALSGSTPRKEAPQRKAATKQTKVEAEASEPDYSMAKTTALDFLLGS